MHSLPLPLAAFLAGVLSFLSPCVLPLVPGYVSLISGASVETLQAADRKLLRTVMLNSLCFILGFSVVFISLGAVATSLGQLTHQYHRPLADLRRHRHHHLRTAPHRNLQDQRALFGQAPAQRQRRVESARLLPHRLCLRLWLDALHWSHPGRNPSPRRLAGHGLQGNPSARRLLGRPGGSVSSYLARRQSLSRLLRPLPPPPAHG